MWDTPFDVSMLGTGRLIIHCPDESSVDALMQTLESNGVRWGGFERRAPTQCSNWNHYGRRTCYWIESGSLSYGSIECANEHDYRGYTKCTFHAGCELPELDMSECAADSLLV